MGKLTGFLENKRETQDTRKIDERLKDYKELYKDFSNEKLIEQSARCMDCGIPFCHSHGCPLGNLIPDWNDLIYNGKYEDALKLLHYTNNFPEFTGRICPAPCEKACTLSINDSPVTIELIEKEIVEYGWANNLIKPKLPLKETGKKVAIIGAGPAGLAAAQQLRRAGHAVVVYEKDEKAGGLLRYGIPDFKLDKSVIDRRLEQLKAEGVSFEYGVNVGVDVTASELNKRFDAILISTGAKVPRDLPIEGRDLNGIHFAMDFLSQNNRIVDGISFPKDKTISAKGKNVVIIGGGDTGSDCVGTSNRQGAKSVTQIELLPMPTDHKEGTNPNWPDWPAILRTSTSHDEGCERMWSIGSKNFEGSGKVEKVNLEKLAWSTPKPGERASFEAIEGSQFVLKADLVLLAMGFIHPEHGPLVKDLNPELDGRGNITTDYYGQTSIKNVFAAGDSASGASLVVRAIGSGRKAAIGIDTFLMGKSLIPDTTLE